MRTPLSKSCSSYLLAQVQSPAGLPACALPAVTISRETGAGGITIAQLIADYLLANQKTGQVPWTVFDRNLVAEVIEEHKLPNTASQYMQEDRRPAISDAVEALLGLHPGNWTLIEHTSHTILNLARRGHVILVGRGQTLSRRA